MVCLLVFPCLSACTPRRNVYRDQWQARTNAAVQGEVDRSQRPPRGYSSSDVEARPTDRQYSTRPLPAKQANARRSRPANHRRKRRKSALSSTEQKRLLKALECSDGSRDDAAQLLGMSRMTLDRRLRQQGIVPKDNNSLSP